MKRSLAATLLFFALAAASIAPAFACGTSECCCAPAVTVEMPCCPTPDAPRLQPVPDDALPCPGLQAAPRSLDTLTPVAHPFNFIAAISAYPDATDPHHRQTAGFRDPPDPITTSHRRFLFSPRSPPAASFLRA